MTAKPKDSPAQLFCWTDCNACEERWFRHGHLGMRSDNEDGLDIYECCGRGSDHFGHLISDQHTVCPHLELKKHE